VNLIDRSSNKNQIKALILLRFQRFMVTFLVQITVRDLAWLSVVNSVGIAQIEAVSRAKPPDRVLNEPRKCRRKFQVKGARVNQAGDGPDDLCAPAGCVAGSSIAVRGAAALLDAGTVQKVMNEGIDGDHCFACLEPDGPMITCSHQQS
jgi:hypothetical protein